MNLIDKYLTEKKGKLVYSDSELKKLGWATVGGRIEDYADLYNKKGDKAAYKEIKSRYTQDADDVYRGLLAFLRWGTNGYY